ncbi:PREDICTED: protein phosphatase 1K, mitochondrial-like [Cyprinodon variegatus]|uniref:protein phosphatase 1K, mitochondrial-like n=1 Tax=Cyprinodon variegatus TaxID=28743 RepID=UPI0007428C7A|nr:PREDICTED: protein phosphatase 1K, mitochondrial-like [Cyprinodon variegatus]
MKSGEDNKKSLTWLRVQSETQRGETRGGDSPPLAVIIASENRVWGSQPRRSVRNQEIQEPRRYPGRIQAKVGGPLLGLVGVRRASGSVRFDSDGSGRPVTWDSFGIWDNRVEEPILLPSSIRYGKPIPQISLSRVGSASVLGLRKENEDRLRIARIDDSLLYFAVFDGHGGPHAADYCCTFMEKFIRDALEEEQDLEKVLQKAFIDADKTLHTHLSFFNNESFLKSGTTATVALLHDGIELVVGSVGDSRAMLCRKGHAKKLTKDHTPDRKDERKRY